MTAGMPSLATQNSVIDMNINDEIMNVGGGDVTPTEDGAWLLPYLTQTSQPTYQPPQPVSIPTESAISLSSLLGNYPGINPHESSGVSTMDVLMLLARRGLLKLD